MFVTAYIDPTVVTYAIQAFAGIAVAVGAVVIVYWRKAKKKVSTKLGIEENQKKEVEEEVIGGFGTETLDNSGTSDSFDINEKQ